MIKFKNQDNKTLIKNLTPYLRGKFVTYYGIPFNKTGTDEEWVKLIDAIYDESIDEKFSFFRQDLEKASYFDDKFQKQHYGLQDKVIKSLTEEQKETIVNYDMDKMKIVPVKFTGSTKRGVYQVNNAGKVFLSFDMVSAGWQIAQKILPDFFYTEDFGEFMRGYTNLESPARSKMFRSSLLSRIFGTHFNKITKQYTYSLYHELKVKFPEVFNDSNVETILADEIILNIGDIEKSLCEEITKYSKEELGIELHYELYKLVQVDKMSGFIKEDLFKDKNTLKMVASTEVVEYNSRYEISKAIETILNPLNENGYLSYVVGGAVRSMIVGQRVSDIDITTNARPAKVVEIFESLGYKVTINGINFGVISVVADDEIYEIATFRNDSGYMDYRHPKEVTYTDTLRDDIIRRDFTCNAIAVDSNFKIHDYVGGVKDCQAKTIRMVGDADVRIKEDVLRIFRAIRFAVSLDFDLDDILFDAIKENAHLCDKIPHSRINAEMIKMLSTNNSEKGIRLMSELGILKYAFPSVAKTVGFDQKSPYHHEDLFEHTMSVLRGVDKVSTDYRLKLAALYHDVGKIEVQEFKTPEHARYIGHEFASSRTLKKELNVLKYTNDTVKYVSKIVTNHGLIIPETRKSELKFFFNLLNKFQFTQEENDGLSILVASDKVSHLGTENNEVYYYNLFRKFADYSRRPHKAKDLLVNGSDLKEIGFEGAEIAFAIKSLIQQVYYKPEFNTKEWSLEFLKRNKISLLKELEKEKMKKNP